MSAQWFYHVHAPLLASHKQTVRGDLSAFVGAADVARAAVH